MPQQDDLLARLRVASPCPVSWERMEGGERVRFCRECSLHVYDFSEMTAEEVRALVTRAEGRVCGRLYRRADGTVLTRDCPVGLRAVRRRVARAAASFAAIVSLFSAAAAQTKQKDQSKQDEKVCETARGLAVERKPSQTAAGSFAVEITDPAGAVIPGATATLTNGRTGEKFTQTTTGEGAVKFIVPSADEYTFEVSAQGFKRVRIRRLRLTPSETASTQIAMPLSADTMEMGIVVMSDTMLDDNVNGKTTFNSKQITSLPHG